MSQDTPVQGERLLTVDELADILGVHKNYVYDLASRGSLPSFKIGGMRRFRPSEVDDWLEGQRWRADTDSEDQGWGRR